MPPEQDPSNPTIQDPVLDPNNPAPQPGDKGYLETIKKIRAERDEQSRKAKDLETRLQEMEQYKAKLEGIDPEKFAEYKRQVEEAEETRQKTAQEQAQIIERIKQEKQALESKLTEKDKTLQRQAIESKVREAFFDNGGRRGQSDSLKANFLQMVLPHALQRVRLDDRGEITVIDPETGHTELDPTTGKIKTLEGLMMDFAKDDVLGAAFDPKSLASGGGFVPGSNGGFKMPLDDLMKLPNADIARIGRQTQRRR